MWTIQQVKDQLPPIKASFNGQVYDAHITGRKLDFPKVWIEVSKGQFVDAEFAWQTLVNALNGKGIVQL